MWEPNMAPFSDQHDRRASVGIVVKYVPLADVRSWHTQRGGSGRNSPEGHFDSFLQNDHRRSGLVVLCCAAVLRHRLDDTKGLD
jgi:hypothetical protein